MLRLVMKHKWFELIKSGQKRNEYRVFKKYWIKRICGTNDLTLEEALDGFKYIHNEVEFIDGYKKNAEKMVFKISKIYVKPCGINTDMCCNEPVFVICIGNKLG